jgi:hypothetical protein
MSKLPTKKFVCLTQTANIQVFAAPSNRTYQSIKGAAFEVEGDLDINFFLSNSSRFKAMGFIDSLKAAVTPKSPVPDVVDELEAFLSSVDGLSKTSISKVLSAYTTISEVKDDLETGKNRFTIPNAQRLALSQALGLTPSDDEDVVVEGEGSEEDDS